MKYLKYLLYVVIGLVLIFLAFGLMKPIVSYGSEIVVDKSVKEAWAVSQDESLYPLWLEGFQSMELISGEKNQKGSKHKVVVRPNDGNDEFEMIETLNEIVEFEKVDMHFDSDMMDFNQIMNFEEKDGKTTITTESQVIGKGLMMKSMFAMMEVLTGSFTAQEQKNMDGLAKLINENTKNYYPTEVPVAIPMKAKELSSEESGDKGNG